MSGLGKVVIVIGLGFIIAASVCGGLWFMANPLIILWVVGGIAVGVGGMLVVYPKTRKDRNRRWPGEP